MTSRPAQNVLRLGYVGHQLCRITATTTCDLRFDVLAGGSPDGIDYLQHRRSFAGANVENPVGC